MDLINYYAKHGPKMPSNGRAAANSTRSTDTKQSPTALPMPKASPEDEDKAADSDIEENDDQDIPHEELLLFVRHLRGAPNSTVKAQLFEFNKTHIVVSL
jgi:hypothetical protein